MGGVPGSRFSIVCLPITSVDRIGMKLPCRPSTPHVPSPTATRHCIETCESTGRSAA